MPQARLVVVVVIVIVGGWASLHQTGSRHHGPRFPWLLNPVRNAHQIKLLPLSSICPPLLLISNRAGTFWPLLMLDDRLH